MLTIESKFAEFIALCVKNGACANFDSFARGWICSVIIALMLHWFK